MLLKTIKLKNFRNHKNFLLNINESTTLIIGENGSGKTSILEAIYICLRGKSFKGTDKEICKRSEKFYRVELDFFNKDKVILRWEETKEFEVNGKKIKRLLVKNKYPVILFEPSDLYLVAASPTRRREYLDRFLSQFDESYIIALRKYNKALKQRNDLLKSVKVNSDNIFSWNVILAQYGVALSNKRRKMIEKINLELTKVYRNIANNKDDCAVVFNNIEINENSYLNELMKRFEKDKYVGYTSFGSHRDDYSFWFNGVLMNRSASRGETRSVILSLKFIEAKIIEKEGNKKPIILLDDIFSELDEKRQKKLVDNFKNNQIIITSTNVPEEMELDITL